jgi:exopolysaccharide production protein ExoZ
MIVAEKRKLRLLQIGRGIAVNLVLFSHLHAVEHKYFDLPMLPDVSRLGIAGVDFFFVLSGFIMAAVAGRGISAGHFLWQRAARIYPMYWLASLVVLLIWIARPDMVNASVQGPISLWCSFALFPADNLPLLAVGWTLIFEVYFYLIFGIVIASRISIAGGMLIWLVIYGAACLELPATSPVGHLVTSPLNLEFMAGAAVGIAWKRTLLPLRRGATLVAVIATVGGFYLASRLDIADSAHLELLRIALFGIPSVLIVYVVCAAEQKDRAAVPAILVSLGDWSYAVYLSHVLVLSALGRLVAVADRGAVGAAIVICAGLIASNGAGWALHRFVERPTLAFLYGLWLKRKGPQLTVEKPQAA